MLGFIKNSRRYKKEKKSGMLPKSIAHINYFAFVAIRGTLAFSSFYFEQNAKKLMI